MWVLIRANSLALKRCFVVGMLAQQPMSVSVSSFWFKPVHSGKQFGARLWLWYAVVFGLCAGCHTSQGKISAAKNGERERYPTQWWAPVPTNGAPAWEIFPQDAG